MGPAAPGAGAGRTAHLWAALATLGAVDLTVARVVEPHLDALAILAETADGHLGRVGGGGPGRPAPRGADAGRLLP